MSIKKEEMLLEEKNLRHTIAVIDNQIKNKNVNIEEYKKDIVKSKKFIWEQKNEFYDADLYSAMDNEDFQVSLVNRDIVKVYKLYRSKETPYFSRVDFQTDDSCKFYYIGLTGVDEDFEPIIYDWRTPVGNLYYNYGLGPSAYASEEGLIKGETTLKRQFDIKRGRIENVYDSSIDTRDEMLLDVLNSNTSATLKNIVSTIQKEQNEIIRYSGTSTLIVEGTAGSGKTSVAMHRVAYLLYNQKDLNNNNVLILSPNTVFSEYISSVLPELGEDNVLTTTFDDFASNYIKGIKTESIMDFVERHYEVKKYEESGDGQTRYIDRLNAYLSEYYDSLAFKKKIGLKTKFISSKELNEIKSKVPKNLGFEARMSYMAEKICREFDLDEVKNAHNFQEKLMDILGIPKNPVEIYEAYSHEKMSGTVPYENIFAVLYLYFEIWGYPSFGHIKAVVIDEAQDYSMWQFEFLKRIFNRAVFTILGDKNQRVNPYIKYDSLEKLTELFKNPKYKKLINTYRSSEEIIEYSNKILGLTGINSIRGKNGLEVVEKDSSDLATDIKKEIARFEDLGYKKLAVITKTKKEAERLKKEIGTDAMFVPVYLAKGLEFDGVIIASSKDGAFYEDEKNLLYVAATRALHALSVIREK